MRILPCPTGDALEDPDGKLPEAVIVSSLADLKAVHQTPNPLTAEEEEALRAAADKKKKYAKKAREKRKAHLDTTTNTYAVDRLLARATIDGNDMVSIYNVPRMGSDFLLAHFLRIAL